MGAELKRRRLRHRIPVSLRHYWKLIAGSIGTVAVLILVIGSIRVSALVYSEAAEGFTVNWDVQGTKDLFDTSVAHEISLDYDQDDYHDMVETFQDSGEKEWVKTDITIDGVTIPDVGIRLKGNSTLMSLGGGRPGGMELPEGMPPGVPPGMELPEGVEVPEGMFPGGMGSSLSFDEPASLPWLVDFSKFVDGQVYEGDKRIALRVDSGMGGGSTLTEAVAAELVEAGGQPSYDWTYSTVSVNGSDAVTRRVVDIMDVTWAWDEYGENAGVLYKGRAGGQFAYQGEDPGAYEDDFRQINMEGAADTQPIINFLKWYDEADEETFAAELGQWLDIESFAAYAALQNLLVNGDDLSGPGSNYYLWYDFGTGLFSVITWDLDLSLQRSDLGPEDSPSMMGAMPGGMGRGDGAEGTEGTPPDGTGTPPDGTGPPPGFELPEGVEMPPGMDGGNDLKQRFLESGAFDDEYMNAYQKLYEALYVGGAAVEAVDRAAAAAALNGADVTEAAADLTTLVTERAEFLAAELGAG